jgi:hypothetical protein
MPSICHRVITINYSVDPLRLTSELYFGNRGRLKSVPRGCQAWFLFGVKFTSSRRISTGQNSGNSPTHQNHHCGPFPMSTTQPLHSPTPHSPRCSLISPHSPMHSQGSALLTHRLSHNPKLIPYDSQRLYMTCP